MSGKSKHRVMSKIIDLLSLLVLTTVLCDEKGVAANKPEPDCVTPDDALGACVDVRYCVTIMTALINGDHKKIPEVAQFLRESQCGITAGSQKVCCHIDSIDFGESPVPDTNSTTTVVPVTQTPQPHVIPPIQSPPPVVPPVQQQPALSDFEKCGKLEQSEPTPSKWIAELWYKHNKPGNSVYESKCIGTVVSLKHVIVPAHCVASLPAQISLDHLTIENDDYSVGKIFIHASYNQPKFANDIAIIELDVELSQNQKESAHHPINNAICLGQSQSHDKSIVGIMKTEQSPLRHAIISLISNNQCSELFDQQFTDLTSSQFCARIQSNESDISPFIGAVIMTFDSIKQQFSLKGFTSTVIRTEQSLDESRPFILTDLEAYQNWIRTALSEIELQPNIKSHDNDDVSNRKVLDSLKECQVSGEKGRCIIEDYCTLYKEEHSDKTPAELEFMKSNKCSTGSNRYHEDGICCPEKYVNQTALQVVDFDVRTQGKHGVQLLDLELCGQVDPSRRIVGGRQAELKEFPWYALIKHKVGRLDKFLCGGSLISSRYVLTCAHCITDIPYEVAGVRLGEHDFTTDPDCKINNDYDFGVEECNPPVVEVGIEDLLPHPNYNSPRFTNDIGLIRMSRDVELKRGHLIPICLPINTEMQQTLSNRATVAGFGFTEHGRDSNVLLKILVPKVPKETCQSLHRTSIQLSEGHMCYGGEGIIDSCKGDSGSPLLSYAIVNSKLRAIQTGIVASGHSECGRNVTGIPGIYTDVSKYTNWILQNMYAN